MEEEREREGKISKKCIGCSCVHETKWLIQKRKVYFSQMKYLQHRDS